MKISKIFSLGHIVIGLTVVILVTLLLGYTLPVKPVTISDITVNAISVKQGDETSYTLTRCRNIGGNPDGTTIRVLVNQDNPKALPIPVGAPTQSSDGMRGCGEITREFIIPDETPTGHYKLEIRTSYPTFLNRDRYKEDKFSNTFAVGESE